MKEKAAPSALRILLPVGLGTCLSLAGDASLYAVLPTHTAAAGVSVAAVGILLSANRFVRLVLNGPAGVAYARYSRRRLYAAALFIGAFSTGIYALSRGFWPLLMGRLLWGLAWAGIWIGGNTIVAEASSEDVRGRWVGLYQGFFFLGAAGGAFLGGLLTDVVGYHRAMGVAAGLTFSGACIALLTLPETRATERPVPHSALGVGDPILRPGPAMAAPLALYGVNRLVVAGVLSSTLGLLLQQEVGAQIRVARWSVGVATLTGSGLGLSTLVAMASATLLGALSDRAASRWRVVAGGLMPGVVGFALLSLGAPWSILVGIPLTAFASGSNQSLSTTLIDDLSSAGERSKHLGMLFTVGDLASAVGPPLAYALIPLLGIKAGYALSAGALASMLVVALWLGSRRSGAARS